MKAVDYTVNSPHLVLGSELAADFRVKPKSSTPYSSPGPRLPAPGLVFNLGERKNGAGFVFEGPI